MYPDWVRSEAMEVLKGLKSLLIFEFAAIFINYRNS